MVIRICPPRGSSISQNPQYTPCTPTLFRKVHIRISHATRKFSRLDLAFLIRSVNDIIPRFIVNVNFRENGFVFVDEPDVFQSTGYFRHQQPVEKGQV